MTPRVRRALEGIVASRYSIALAICTHPEAFRAESKGPCSSCVADVGEFVDWLEHQRGLDARRRLPRGKRGAGAR